MSKLRDEVRAALENAAGELLELRDGRQFFGKTTRKWLAALCDESEAMAEELALWRAGAVPTDDPHPDKPGHMHLNAYGRRCFDAGYKSGKAQHVKDVETTYYEGYGRGVGDEFNHGRDDVAAAWLASNAKKQLEQGQ